MALFMSHMTPKSYEGMNRFFIRSLISDLEFDSQECKKNLDREHFFFFNGHYAIQIQIN